MPSKRLPAIYGRVASVSLQCLIRSHPGRSIQSQTVRTVRTRLQGRGQEGGPNRNCQLPYVRSLNVKRPCASRLYISISNSIHNQATQGTDRNRDTQTTDTSTPSNHRNRHTHHSMQLSRQTSTKVTLAGPNVNDSSGRSKAGRAPRPPAQPRPAAQPEQSRSESAESTSGLRPQQ